MEHYPDVVSIGFKERGRHRGVPFLIAAAVLGGYVLVNKHVTGGLFLGLTTGTVILSVLGVFLVVFGDPSKRPIRQIIDVEPPPEVRALIETTARPFHFCLACHDVAADAECERCGSIADVMDVRNDEDARIALLGLAPTKTRKRRGGRSKWKQIEDRDVSAKVRAVLLQTPRPFHFCTGCRSVSQDTHCRKCNSGLDVLEIRDDGDAQLALSAMS
jgi:hypothetical protein